MGAVDGDEVQDSLEEVDLLLQAVVFGNQQPAFFASERYGAHELASPQNRAPHRSTFSYN